MNANTKLIRKYFKAALDEFFKEKLGESWKVGDKTPLKLDVDFIVKRLSKDLTANTLTGESNKVVQQESIAMGGFADILGSFQREIVKSNKDSFPVDPKSPESNLDETEKIEKDIFEAKLTDLMSSGGLRYNSGKLRWSLVDFEALEDMVRVLEFGSKKYSDNNWKKGLSVNQICESLLRHTFEIMSGKNNDEESRLPLAGHILCNAMFLAYMLRFKKEFDDRFIDNNKKENADTI